ncbi:putative quinol monooxygenase [Marinomonas sp.]
MRVSLQGYLLVSPEDLAAVRQALPLHISLTRQEVVCVLFQVTESHQQTGRFDVHEEFVDRPSFEAHQARVKNSDWGAISRHAERFYQITEDCLSRSSAIR